MIQKKCRQIGLALLLPILALTLLATPVRAALSSSTQVVRNQGTTPINATIYLTTGMLQPLFQAQINQQVPGAVNNAINTIVSNMPASDRSWAGQMATTLIQPSATLSRLTPQANGLATSLRISLYPGDPHPINASMLVKFSIVNSSTVQVSAVPVKGSPTLVSGPLTTFQIPLGQLNAITTTPACGDAALAVNLQFPLSLGLSSTNTSTGGLAVRQLSQKQTTSQASTTAYIEIPATSLASLGSSIGTIPVSSSLSAKNVQLTVQGSNLVITSDIYLGFLQIASATTYVQPTTANGNLAVNVQKTDVTFLQFFTFPNNSYNQQIEQILNTKLNGALAGKFSVSSAAIGSNSHVPCAASDSLILSGTTNLV
jgi:hypothetical protein